MRDIPGYEGLYAATEDGRIWSYRSKKFLKPRKRKDGYLQVYLYKDGKQKTCKIHRLIGETYLPNIGNKPCINHIDEDKSNNALQNLEWTTYKENNNYGTRTERAAKSCQKKVLCLETGEIFESSKDAAKAINRSTGNICNCLKGRYKTCAGLHWKYYDQKEEI